MKRHGPRGRNANPRRSLRRASPHSGTRCSVTRDFIAPMRHLAEINMHTKLEMYEIKIYHKCNQQNTINTVASATLGGASVPCSTDRLGDRSSRAH